MPELQSVEQETRPRVPPDHRLPSGNEGTAGAARGGSLLRKLGLLILLALALGFAYWKVRSNKQDAADTATKTAQASNRPIPVTAAPVVAKTMPISVTALGTVTAYNTVTVKSRVDGQLLSVNVREGQQVKQGQVLAMIDPRPYQAVQAQAEGQLEKDQAAANNATAEAARYTALLAAGVISKESQQTQVANAGQSAGALSADRAQIQAAKVNVAYTRITSPINGVVGLRQVDAGNIVHASDANGLLVVTQLQPIAVIFTMPEDQLPAVLKLIRGGRKLVADAYDRSEAKKLASGTLLTLDNEIDTATGTVKAKAVFDNKDGALFPNQFVNVRLILEERQNALVMPASALQNGVDGTFVYVVKPGDPPKSANEDDGSAASPGKGAAGGNAAGGGSKPGAGVGGADQTGPPRKPYYVVKQNVVVDLTEGSQIILKSGVNAGDQVVVDGQEKLKINSRVDPKQGIQRGGGGAQGSGGAGVGTTGGSAGGVAGRPQGQGTDTQPGQAGSPDTGQGSIDEPGRHGQHGPGTAPNQTPDQTPDQAPGRPGGGGAGGAHGGHKRPQPGNTP